MTMPIKTFHTAAIFALAITVFAAIEITAQSGRRLPKGSPPVAVPTPTPEQIRQPKPPPKPDFTVKVFSNIDSASSYTLPSPERMHSWAVERLRRTSLLDVRDAGSANRRDAIKQAKAETEIYVVLLDLHVDPFAAYGRASARSMWIDLTAYYPVTGKIKFSRTLALGQNSTRMPGSTNVMRACFPGVYGNDLLLLEASIEAADNVMNTFNVPLPPLCRNPGL
jgi:hypothetical protein